MYADEASQRGKRFRRRFRVPWKMFKWIVDRINTDERLVDPDATKRSGIPVDILVLACLRLLGRYPHYEDLEEICKKKRNNERNENIQRRHECIPGLYNPKLCRGYIRRHFGSPRQELLFFILYVP